MYSFKRKGFSIHPDHEDTRSDSFKCPCKNCVPPDRSPDCHGTCERYIAWQKWRKQKYAKACKLGNRPSSGILSVSDWLETYDETMKGGENDGK